MSKVGKIARRTFLVGSVAIAGGVVFGTYLARRPLPNPMLEDLPEGAAALTPHVLIDAEGITLITPRADMGQGSYSIQAHLIAEELDIDPASARISPGRPDAAYYNRVVMGEGLPFPAYDTGWIAEQARAVMATPAKLFALQITGGSTTVPDGYERLRLAGAVARETLKAAASRRTGVPRDRLSTDQGAVVLPDGARIPYTDLAAQAAAQDPVTDVTLRDPSRWRLLGRADMGRLDMVAKCTGTETYGIDLRLPGMLFATVRANPGLGAGLSGFDASAAEAMRGVRAVVPITSGVAVIADNTWRAFRAAEEILIDWAPPDWPGTSDEIWQVLEQTLDTPDALDHRQRDDGDVDAALSSGDVLEAAYRVPYLAHAPLEPMNATVRVTQGAVEIWTGTQIPIFVRDRAAQIAGVPPEAVRVTVLPMGGSFGHRLEMTHVEQAVEVAMALPGTPVQMTWRREEDMTHDYPRPASVARGRGRVEAGRVVALDLSVAQSAMAPEWLGRLSGRALPGPDLSITTGSWDQPFAIPDYRVSGYRAPAMVPVSSWRSVGASGNGFYHECFLDELIHSAGADPLEERLRLCMHDTSRKVLEEVGRMSDWSGPVPGPGQGRGLAFTMSFGVPCAQVVDVTATDRGIRLDRVFVALDVGRVLDPTNLEAQAMGGVIFGLGHAMNCELTYTDHRPDQDNYHSYEGMRLHQVPQITVKALSNGARIRGVGEPTVPPAAPALANAIFAATGQRIRALPLHHAVDFV